MRNHFICGLLAITVLIQARAADPNILFIMLDDCGYGDLQCYNSNSKIPTPSIDLLAKNGMRFTDAHTPGSVCVPSRYGFLTGRYPTRARSLVIKAGTDTVASFLNENGYRTAMIGKWHNGFNGVGKPKHWDGKLADGPRGCGFETFFGLPHSLDIPPYLYIENDRAVAPPTKSIASGKEVTKGIYETAGWNRIQGAFWRAGKVAPGFKHEEVLGVFTNKATQFLRDRKAKPDGKPFFLYLAFAGPHTPWLPSKAFRGKSGAGLYGDFLVEIDHSVGMVLKELKGAGFTQDTLIMLSSDNGPVWYKENGKEFKHRSVGKLRGMKGDAFEGGHRVPFIASWPGKIKPETVCEETICLTDVMRTVAAIIGKPLPDKVGRDSYDISPLLLGTKSGPIRQTTAHKACRAVAIRKGNYKLINSKSSGGFSKVKIAKNAPDGQLYDLVKDPAETTNLYANPEYATILSDLKQELKKCMMKDEGK